MQKREKIIVIAAVIAAIYGAVDFSMSRHQKKAPAIDNQARTDSPSPELLSAEISSLASADNQKIDRLTALINEPWPEEIFTLRPTPLGTEKIDTTTDADLQELRDKARQLVYSGFVDMEGDRIAIINDMDYRIGEQINGFTITKISQESVQVSQHDTIFDIPATTELAPAASVDRTDTLDQNQPKRSP